MQEGSAATGSEGRVGPGMGAPGRPASIPAGPAGYSVYPTAIVRVAGQPFDMLEAFRSTPALEVGARLDRYERQDGDSLARLLRLLHEAIGAAGADDRRALLAAARNLRRHGKLSADQELAVRAAGGGALASVLDGWRLARTGADDARAELERAYRQGAAQSRHALGELARHPRFLNGIALSSASFYEQVRSYLRASAAQPPHPPPRRLEQTLLRYLTRAASKTTPFSTFTSTAVVRLSPRDRGEGLLALRDDDSLRTSVTVNKALYALLVPTLCATPELYPLFAVTANPSLHRAGETLSMLLARGGREHVVVLPASPLVTRCVELIRESGGTMRYDALVSALAAGFGAAAPELAPRVNRMMEAGILQLDNAIAERETAWIPLLLDALRPSPHPVAGRVRELLETLREIADAYAPADPDERHALLARARNALLEVFLVPPVQRGDAGGAPAAGPWVSVGGRTTELRELVETPLYEDTSFAWPAVVNARRLAPALDALATWVDCVSRTTPVWAERTALRAFYDRTYGAAGEVSFPVFYAAFYTAVYEPILRHEREPGQAGKGEPAPFDLPFLRDAKAEMDAMRHTLALRWAAEPAAGCIHLGRDDFPGPEERTLRPPVPGSSMVFAHLVAAAEAGGHDAIVLDKPSAYVGMGKFFTRFLSQFPPRHGAELLAHNTRHGGYLVAELADDAEFSFNGNLHPPLTDYEINYPARVTGMRAGANLPLADLLVQPDPAGPGRLRLLHRPSGREVLPLDLGFLTQFRRPPLFRVLSMFSPCFQDGIPLPWRTGAPGAPEIGEGGVIRRPRVVFERHLILARRSWQVPVETVTGVVAGLAPGAAFRALDRWRRSHGIPRHVFVAADGPARHVRGLRRVRAARKPQYVDLESGVLAELLLEMAAAHEGILLLQEMLPGPESLPLRAGRPYAAELVLQVDRDG